jgi:hypothetical protein
MSSASGFFSVPFQPVILEKHGVSCIGSGHGGSQTLKNRPVLKTGPNRFSRFIENGLSEFVNFKTLKNITKNCKKIRVTMNIYGEKGSQKY